LYVADKLRCTPQRITKKFITLSGGLGTALSPRSLQQEMIDYDLMRPVGE
jgi:hypothetical protein